MDYIKRTICLEGARTRTQGLMPYYEFSRANNSIVYVGEDNNNGNWGQFVANPKFLNDKNKTYETMLRNYYTLLNMVRNGVKLRKVSTKENEIIFTEDLGAFTWNNTSKCFEGGEEPEFLYEYAAYDAKDFYSTRIESNRKETQNIYRSNIPVSNSYIVLIEDYEKFNRLMKYLDGTNYSVLQSGINIDGGDVHLKWARYCQVVDVCIGKINIPSSIYNKHIKVPKSMPCADVAEYIDWLENYETLSADCCNARLYEDMGGKDLLEYLNASAKTKCEEYRNTLNGLEGYEAPYLTMSLNLRQNFTDVGVLTNIDGVEYERNLPESGDSKTRPHGIGSPTGLTIDQIIMGSDDAEKIRRTYPTTEEYESKTEEQKEQTEPKPIEVESLLKTLRLRKKYTDDEDNVLPGLFQNFNSNPAGEMYACVKRGEEKFYKLEAQAYSVEEEGEEKTYWRVIYVQDSTITRDDIYGLNNLNHTGEPPYPARSDWGKFETESAANAIISEQRERYEDCDKDTPNNPFIYKICASKKTWTMYPIEGTPDIAKNGDGLQSEDISKGGTRYPNTDDFREVSTKLYRTITTCSAGIRIAETEEEETGTEAEKDYHYFFFVKYDNSETSPMTLPYCAETPINVYLVSSGDSGYVYRGDFILNGYPKISGKEIEIQYVVGGSLAGDSGGTFTNYLGSGDVYYEKYVYEPAHCDFVALDGVDGVPVWSQYIDFDSASKEFYSTRYNLYRTGNTANIIQMTSSEEWQTGTDSEGSAFAYDAYLTKEEYLINFSLPPKVDVNVTVERGGVSAFEKHYKLAECNTMQDLENYNNGEFFPEY